MNDTRWRIRVMDAAGVARAVDWAADEGWNPGLHDAGPLAAADPSGFLVGELDGEPVAQIAAVRYGRGFGFIGLYIVRAPWRGQGLGLRVWQAGMAHLAGRLIGLDGVPAQQDNYRRSGFALAHRNVRYAGAGEPSAARAAPAGGRLAPLATLPFDTLADWDRAFFADDRRVFLRHWVSQPGARGLAWLHGGQLRGYALLRPCRSGWKFGPLLADTAAGAEALFGTLRATVPAQEPVFLDVPQCRTEAVALAEAHGLRPVFETARMYTGPAPDIALARTWGMTSFELG